MLEERTRFELIRVRFLDLDEFPDVALLRLRHALQSNLLTDLAEVQAQIVGIERVDAGDVDLDQVSLDRPVQFEGLIGRQVLVFTESQLLPVLVGLLRVLVIIPELQPDVAADIPLAFLGQAFAVGLRRGAVDVLVQEMPVHAFVDTGADFLERQNVGLEFFLLGLALLIGLVGPLHGRLQLFRLLFEIIVDDGLFLDALGERQDAHAATDRMTALEEF